MGESTPAEEPGADQRPPITYVRVDHGTAVDANRLNWDDRATVHAASRDYDVDGLVADPLRISSVVQDDLALLGPHLPDGSVDGLDLVHLQCHIGTDSISLSRLGARVTGVDQSRTSLDIARSIAARAGTDTAFVESEVTRAREALTGDFDLVYTSIGTVCWLPDLSAWAHTIASLLRPGGTFFIRDGHPSLATIDFDRTDVLALKYRYFSDGEAERWDQTDTYTDGDTSAITHGLTFEWPHPVSEVLTALLDAGLTLVAFGEQRTIPWKALEIMEPRGDSWVLPEPMQAQLPLTYSIVARKP